MHSEAKRREAAFFLGQLKKSHHATDEFAYFLSAFVSAFRSVTFAMQSEYAGRSPLAAETYSKLQTELKSDDFAKQMRDARNEQQKQGHTWPRLVFANINENSGAKVLFKSAPLPNGFDSRRSIETVFPPENPVPLSGNDHEDLEAMLLGMWDAVTSLHDGAWRRELYIQVHEHSEPMPASEFFAIALRWLDRFEEYISRLARDVRITRTE